MALQIANQRVVEKVDQLARKEGLSKTAAVERAVDHLLREIGGSSVTSERLLALLEQIDRIPDREDAFDPVEWDRHGLLAGYGP